MSAPATPQPLPDPTVPDSLAADLRRLHRPDASIEIPPGVDDRVALLTRWHLSRAGDQTPDTQHETHARLHPGTTRSTPARRRRLAPLRWITYSSAAAAILLASVLSWPLLRSQSRSMVRGSPGTPSTPSAPDSGKTPSVTIASLEDVNNDGIIDILDSQRLSFLLHTQPAAVKPEWDYTADGAVDDEDAEVIARHVVLRKDGGAG